MAVITILGAGVMGSAMCLPARDTGHEVRLVGTHLDQAIIDSVAHDRAPSTPQCQTARGREGPSPWRFRQGLGDDTDLIILGVSSAGVGWAIDRLCEALTSAGAGDDDHQGPDAAADKLIALPDFVQSEVKRRTGLDARPCRGRRTLHRGRARGAPPDRRGHHIARSGLAQKLCDMLTTDYYHPRVSDDLEGVELCAAFKNFFAISVGWAAGQFETCRQTENSAFNFNAAAVIFDQAIARDDGAGAVHRRQGLAASGACRVPAISM